jgi:hypothetical protein
MSEHIRSVEMPKYAVFFVFRNTMISGMIFGHHSGTVRKDGKWQEQNDPQN